MARAKKPAKKTKPATKKKPVAKKTKPVAKKKKPVAKRKPVAKPTAAPARAQVALGEIAVPHGVLSIFDIGLMGFLPRHALEPAIIFVDVPKDRPLAVVGERVGKGRFADCWDHVSVVLTDHQATHARKLGEAGVDFARLILMDRAGLDHWQHEDSLDGKADWVFWGRDAAQLARAMRVPKLGTEGYGWADLPVEQAEAHEMRAQQLKSDNKWLLATDLRPHSHHYYALEKARASPTGAGTLALADGTVMLFFTSWGDGVFPVFLDLDQDDRPTRVRIQLARGVD